MHNTSDIDIATFLAADFIPGEILESNASQKDADIPEASDLPKYITNYIGSKQKLLDWIWQNTPEDVKTVFDGFSGSNVVSYMYKRKGLKVYTNDILKYSYHISRAIIENNSVKLSDDEIEKLILPKSPDGSGTGDFISRNFKNTFFTPEVLNILDGLRANIDTLKGYKKDIALFALGKTCITGKGGFGHFSSTTMHGKRRFTQKQFLELYKSNLKRISDLVFDNGQENKAFHGEILDIAPQVKADLAYFDPPYATHFSTTNYETAYHFVEGLMTMWKGKEIKEDSKTKSYQVESKTVTQKTAQEFFENYLNASKHIKYWIISYR
ncbi:MAG: DNA adenine methylase, partial [bacterium]